jgi:penicillin G amidase
MIKQSGSQKKIKSKRLWKRIALWVLIFLMMIIIGALIFIKIIARQGLPDYNADIKLNGLISPVRVIRDAYGTPHIYAQNEGDLYRAVGYVMAQDRMWQMDLLRRVTLGRLSEIFGDDFVDTDLLLRSLRYSEKSKKILESSPPELLEAINSFSDGINQYIAQNNGHFPLEFKLLGYTPEVWEPYQSVNLIGYMAWDLKSGWNELILEELKSKLDSAQYSEILPDPHLYKSSVFGDESNRLMAYNKLLELDKLNDLGLDIFSGSNNWAVSGSKSADGKPILANDMHLSYNVPGIWMQIHEVIPGKLNVSGLALPGQPLIVVGHNDSIAWGMTNTYVDNLDYYEEKINPENRDQYLYKGEWKDFTVCTEKIKSKSGTVFEKIFRYNTRGPVISEFKEIKDKVLTIHWVGDEPSNELLSIYKIDRASNWNDFNDAFQYFRSISQNIVYADLAGNIGLHACAGVPIRKRTAVFEILPGWTDEYNWQGMIPYNELPYEYNPERGYVSSANNKTCDSTYPYHIGTWYSLPYRIERIRELLASKPEFAREDFRQIQNDSKSKLAERIIQKCFTQLDTSKMDPLELKVYSLLKNWDGTMDKALIEPTVLECFLSSFTAELFKDEIGEVYYEKFTDGSKISRIALYNVLETNASSFVDNSKTEKVETMQDIVQISYSKTIASLVGKYTRNTDKWEWGKIHTITLQHPMAKVKILDFLFNLNRGPFEVSGSFHTVAPYSYPGDKPSNVEHGASHRHIYSLSNWDSTLSVIPTGNSGVVTSEFYLDQTELYVNGKYHYDYFSEKAVEENAKYKMVFIPAE